MSSRKDENVSDVMAEMLEFADTDSQTVGRDILRRRIQYFARRIKQAVADCNHLGNAAKTREALDAITRIDTRRLKRLLCELVEAEILDGGQINRTISAVEKARQALSAPPRNCDVGTAEEQAERFCRFCKQHQSFKAHALRSRAYCLTNWAQMPYEEGSEDDK